MGSTTLRVGICILAVLALGVSSYILYVVAEYHVLPGCGDDADCNAVLNSRWERWGPVSVANLGIGGYAVLIMASIVAGIKNPRALPMLARLAANSIAGSRSLRKSTACH